MDLTVKHKRLCIFGTTHDAEWSFRCKGVDVFTGIRVGVVDDEWHQRREKAAQQVGRGNLFPLCSNNRGRKMWHPDDNVWHSKDTGKISDVPVWIEDDKFFERMAMAGLKCELALNLKGNRDARVRDMRAATKATLSPTKFAAYMDRWMTQHVGLSESTLKVYRLAYDSIKSNMGARWMSPIHELDNEYWLNFFSSLRRVDGECYSMSSLKIRFMLPITTVINMARDDQAILGQPLKNVLKRVTRSGNVAQRSPLKEPYGHETTWNILSNIHSKGWPLGAPKKGNPFTKKKPPKRATVLWKQCFTAVLILADTGMNLSDVLKLRASDIDLPKRLIRGVRQKTKAEFVAGLQTSTASFLNWYITKSGVPYLGRLFHKIKTGNIQMMIKEVLNETVGDSSNYDVTRSWRIALRTELAQLGVAREISCRIMGHHSNHQLDSGESTSHDVYLRVSDQEVMLAYEKLELHRINGGYHLSAEPFAGKMNVPYPILRKEKEKTAK
jgi:integrase